MIKNYSVVKKVSSVISEAANEVASNVINDYVNIKGREEEITAQLRGEINRQLLESVKSKLNNTNINGCVFKVATFKKKEESTVGADLAGVVEFQVNDQTAISKAFLAQSKVAIKKRNGHYVVSNIDILKQANDMLKITSDAFFMIYTMDGIYCVPALQVKLTNQNVIDLNEQPFHGFGTFYEEFIKCFIGDHLISPDALDAKNLEDYADKIKAKSLIALTINLNQVSK